MCKRNSPDKNEASMGCGRETLQIKKEEGVEEASIGRVRETPLKKIKPARDV